ncbi:MAG TPA: hypothetical protein PKE26_08900 [Kiritimatiellia bacterium]|nr:hypothetical protein [Kiritimatiellia bacterium]HMO99214.1 hypothetical protein [Kiritimatiellia bacterium]HMP96005.1 hypothetical protein [Kiritimatiellia bacterium]
MKHRVGWIVLIVATLGLSPLSAVITAPVYAQEAAEGDVMTEGQLAEALVNVLGLAAMLPPNPQQADITAILLQNGISPRDGWVPSNVVTLGNLARILVQAMGAADEVENPEDDASWVAYLNSVGVEFGTIEEALGQAPVLSSPVALRAVEVSTDPLRRIPYIRPSDEQQLGADLQTIRRIVERIVEPVEPPKPRPKPPVTPN